MNAIQIPEKPITLMQAAQLFADAVKPGDPLAFRSYLNAFLYRAHRGEIQGRLPTTREPLPTDGILPSDYVEKLVFTATDIRALAKIYDLEVDPTPLPTPSTDAATDPQPAPQGTGGDEKAQESKPKETPKKRVLASTAQDNEILAVIRKLRHEPKKLPDRPAGKSGVRAEVWGYLSQHRELRNRWSESKFKHAWDRLRKNKEIMGGE